jgi:hypothetical protein
MALRANGEKSNVLIATSSIEQHGYELTPDTAGARIRPAGAPDGGRFRKAAFNFKTP